jgi:hypothetical protein
MDYDSLRRGVLYNTFTEDAILIKLVKLIKMYLNETYIKLHIDKDLSD